MSSEPGRGAPRAVAIARWFAVASLVLSLAASAFLLLVPVGTTVTAESESGVAERRIERRTLLESEGSTAVAIAAAPVALSSLAVLGRRRRASRVASAVLLTMFCGGLAASVGLFYTPAALAMVVAAIAG